MSDSILSNDRRRAEAGFTIVEVLIAIVVLVFGLIAVTNLFIVAGSSNTVANQATAATDVAAGIVEGFKNQSWNTLTPVTMAAVGSPQRTDNIVGVGTINSYWSITDVNDVGSTVRVKFIRVRSEGASRLSRGRSRAELTTYRTCTTPALGCP